MVLVDTSVWIDYFNGVPSPETGLLDTMLGVEEIGIGDLILTEVLQGFRTEGQYRTGKRLLTSLEIHEMLGVENAVRSAEHYRTLRKQGITIRKTADVIIATYCIVEGYPLLFSDTDFVPFVEKLGLIMVR